MVLSLAAMVVAMSMPAFAAGKGVPKGGQGPEFESTNPGESVNDEHGDQNNDVANAQCNPWLSGHTTHLPDLRAGGCGNN